MNTEKLKIFFSQNWLIKDINPTVMLYPWLSFSELDESDPDKGRFQEYAKTGDSFFEVVNNLNNCDFAVFPHNYFPDTRIDNLIHTILKELLPFEKKLILFYNSDDDQPLIFNNIILFRTSFYKSSQKEFEFSMPGWSVDFKKYFQHEQVFFLDKKEKPSVSYCGYIDYEKLDLKLFIKKIISKPNKSHLAFAQSIRGEACRNLKQNKSIECNFIIRNGFWAQEMDDKIAARSQYAKNMQESLYAIVTRGGGNFSYRLYEVLSCGRIPIFINTDAVLPCDNIVDWKKHVLWLEHHEIKKIDKILLNFHESKSNEELLMLQKSNRILYEKFISPNGFFNQLKHIIP